MELLSHDYGNGGVVDISAVDAYSKIELCTPILLLCGYYLTLVGMCV
jgi:hypothetical protein